MNAVLPFSIFLIWILLAVPGQSQIGTDAAESLRFYMEIQDEDGLMIQEEYIQVYLEMFNNNRSEGLIEINWRIFTAEGHPVGEFIVLEKLDDINQKRSYCPAFAFEEPGFYLIIVNIHHEGKKIYESRKVTGKDPDKISSFKDAEPDFEQFWMESLSELSSIKPEFKTEPVSGSGNPKINLYRVEMKGFGNFNLQGWLEVPSKPGLYPALLRVPGYETNMLPIEKFEDMIVFSFNPRDHGQSDDSGVRGFDMWLRGMEDKSTYFYRGLYLDCIRAMDYLVSRTDVDTSRIAIWGESQGGGLSFFTTGLDPRIDLCIADIPFLSDWKSYFTITHWPELDDWFEDHPDQNWQTMFRTLSYFDTKNLAERIHCPVIMAIGLQDDICPPTSSFFTYNLLQSPKSFIVYKEQGHELPEIHYENIYNQIREIFGLDH